MYTDYTKLWKLLIDKGLTKTDLCRATGMSTRTLAKLVANKSVTTDTLLSVCETLDCGIEDVMEHLGLARWTILAWIKEGKLPACRVGKKYVFKLSEVDEYIRTDIDKKN